MRVGVLDRVGQTHLDAADRSGQLLDGVEVDHHEVVGLHAGDVLDRTHGAARVAAFLTEADVEPDVLGARDDLVRTVRLLGGAVRDVGDQVAGDAQRRGVGPVLGDVEEDVGVGVAGAALVAVPLIALTGPLVGADDQYVEGRVGGDDVLVAGVADVHGVQVAVEVLVQRVPAHRQTDQHEGHHAARPEQRLLAAALRLLALAPTGGVGTRTFLAARAIGTATALRGHRPPALAVPATASALVTAVTNRASALAAALVRRASAPGTTGTRRTRRAV